MKFIVTLALVIALALTVTVSAQDPYAQGQRDAQQALQAQQAEQARLAAYCAGYLSAGYVSVPAQCVPFMPPPPRERPRISIDVFGMFGYGGYYPYYGYGGYRRPYGRHAMPRYAPPPPPRNAPPPPSRRR